MRDRNVWLFNAGNLFAGNPKWLFLYIVEHHPEITAYWFCYRQELVAQITKLGYKAVLYDSREASVIGARAGVYVVEQNKEVYQDYLEGITVLNLWHGVGCKSIEHAVRGGFMSDGIVKKHIRNERIYRNQLFLVTSPLMESHFSEQCKLEERQLVRAGYPSSFSPEIGLISTFDHNLLRNKVSNDNTRIAVYAPTFRDFDKSGFLAKALPDIDALIEVLISSNTLLILKMHPQMEQDPQFALLKNRYQDAPNLLFWDNSNDFYEIMNQIDVAIIDYSSVFYDLVAHGVKSFIRYIFDYDTGAPLRDFAIDYLENTCGTICKSFDALLRSLSTIEETPTAERQRIERLFWSYAENSSMEDIISRAIDGIEHVVELPTLYSFDVFDTIIGRSFRYPDIAFDFVRARMLNSNAQFPLYLVENFVKVRKWAEQNCRQFLIKKAEGNSEAWTETDIDSIYSRIGELFALPLESIELLKHWELEVEYACSIPIDENINKVRELKEAGEMVVLISDMYLPEAFIRKLLIKADPIFKNIPLFLSSSSGNQKSRKTLFYEVFHRLDYKYEKWIHVGDNKKADFEIPQKLGISCQLYITPAVDRFAESMRGFSRSFDLKQLAGHLDLFTQTPGVGEKDVFAYCRASSYFVPYVHWAVYNAIANGINTLYFISRDGYLLKKIADAIIQSEGLTIRTHYIYGSRKAWRIPALFETIDEDFFSSHGNFTGVDCYEAFLEAAGMDNEQLHELVPELAMLANLQEIDRDTRDKAVEVLSRSTKYRNFLLAESKTRREVVCRYLKQEINFEESFAFVEYWGRGYTQTCLSKLLNAASSTEKGSIFYYARSIYPTIGQDIRYNYSGNTWSLIFVEAILANIPYLSVKEYREFDDSVHPVLVDNANCDTELLDALEKWLPRFAVDFCKLNAIDREGLGRAFYDFGLSHFHNNPTDNLYLQCIAPLKDTPTIYGNPVEYAPPWSPELLLARSTGKATPSSNKKMTLARSSKPYKIAYRIYKALKKVKKSFTL